MNIIDLNPQPGDFITRNEVCKKPNGIVDCSYMGSEMEFISFKDDIIKARYTPNREIGIVNLPAIFWGEGWIKYEKKATYKYAQEQSGLNEVWMPLWGIYFRYFVSSKGRVYSTKKYKCLSNFENGHGYLQCVIYDDESKKFKNMLIHRLVAETFSPATGMGITLFVNHKDSDKKNNYVSNLEWVTPRENSKHHYENSTDVRSHVGVNFYKPNRKWKAGIYKDGKDVHIGYFDTEQEAIEARREAELSLPQPPPKDN